MLLSAVDKITVTATTDGSRNTYTLPISFVSIDKVDYVSEGEVVYTPLFADYTMIGNIFSIPGTYAGGFEIYYKYNGPEGKTLEMLYQKVVSDIGEDIDTLLAKDATGNYTDVISFNKIRSEINRAVRKIARDKLALSYAENIILDSNKMFNITSLTKAFTRIILLTDINGQEYSFDRVSTTQYQVPYSASGTALTLTYGYIPEDMVYTTDIIDLPEGDIDTDIVCYWADYMWFKIDGNSRKSNTFLELWNDGFNDEINTSRGEVCRIKDWGGG